MLRKKRPLMVRFYCCLFRTDAGDLIRRPAKIYGLAKPISEALKILNVKLML